MNKRSRKHLIHRYSRATCGTVEGLEGRQLLSVQPIAQVPPGTKDSNPHSFFEFDGQVLFAASGPQGTELWRTDGTPGGTQLVRDIAPGGSSNPDHFIAFGGAVYFTASDGTQGIQLWKTDGTTAGTVLVSGASNPSTLTVADGRLFFLSGTSLWSTDGTPAGTAAVANASNVPFDSAIVAAGPSVYFVNRDATHGAELWKTDGAASPATLVADIQPGAGGSNPQRLVALGTNLVFTADGGSGREVWVTGGTTPPVQLTSVTDGDPARSPAQLTAVGNTAYFVAGNNPAGLALWKTDGTVDGTQVVRGLVPDLGAAAPTQLTAAAGLLFFVFNATGSGTELWKSDGTFAGTTIVKDLTPGPGGTSFSSLQPIGNQLYFYANGWYRSDGTAAGTVPDNRAYPPGSPRTANGQVIYAGTDPVFGVEPFGTDDTPAGTGMLADINTFSRAVSVGNFTRAGAYTYFSAVTPQGGGGLWRTDGTTAGTICLSVGNVAPTIHDGGEGPGGRLFYTGNSWLWTSDGTPQGTLPIAQIRQQPDDGPLRTIVRAGNLVYFVGDSPNGYYNSLWRSDGTAAGTYRLPVVWTNDFTGYDGVPLGSFFYFTAPASDGHSQLWRTDGTVAGTGVFYDIPPTSSSFANSAGIYLYAANSTTLFFGYFQYLTENSLWRTDGTQAGTIKLLGQAGGPGVVYQNKLYLLTQDHLYKSDGTVAGTVPVAAAGTGYYSGLLSMQVAGNLLFFTAGDPNGSNTVSYLWKSDGTATGTAMLRPGGSSVVVPAALTPAGNLVYFPATGGLWRSDGTDSGTLLDTPSGNPVLYSAGAAVHNSAGDSLVGYRSDVATGANVLVRFAPSAIGSISGRVFDDVNHNGIFDAGDQPLVGAEVYLDLNNNGTLDPADVTAYADATGTYSFPALLPGTYSVRQILAAGRTQTHPATVSASVVVASQPLTGADFGSASLRPRANPGGPYGAPAGGQVTLDGTASFSLSGAITAYQWDFDFDPEIGFTLDATGARPIFSAGATPGTRIIALRVTDSTGQTSAIVSTTVNITSATGSITGGVFNDLNNNGLRDATEPGGAGITIYLDLNANGALDLGEPTALTDSSGTYRFANLAAGAYVVRQALPGGWARTAPLAASATLSLVSGQAAVGPNFGDVQVSTVPMNFSYLLTLAQHYGQAGTFASGDVNGDGTVNFADLLLVAQNYGHPLAAAAAAGPDMTDSLARLHLPARKRSRQ